MAKTKIEIPLIEDPSLASPARPACQTCNLFSACLNPFMPAYVPMGWTGKLLVWGEGPGEKEDKAGRPFVGPAGKILYDLLAEAGLTPKDIALTNTVRCRPVNNKTPTAKEARACRPFAVHDVLSLRPEWVLGVGDAAAKAILGSSKASLKTLRKRVYDGADCFGPTAKGIKVSFTYHPASTLYAHGSEQKDKIRDDLDWLVRFTGYRPGPEDRPVLGEEGIIALDVEWDRTYRLLTLARAWGGRAEVSEERDTWVNWLEGASLPGLEQHIVGHSVFQDLSIMRANGLSLGPKHISGTETVDTVLLARLVNENLGAYDLESLTTGFCGTEPWKSKSDTLLSKMKVKDFWSIPADIRQERCRLDAWGAGLLAEKLCPEIDPKLLEFTHLTAATLRRVEMAGIKIDKEEYGRLKEILSKHLNQRGDLLRDLATKHVWNPKERGDAGTTFSPSNDNHFRELLYDYIGATPRGKTPGGEPSVDHAALTLLYQDGTPEEQEAVLARLRYEKAEKLYSTYIGQAETTDEDGKGLAKHLTRDFFVFQRINPLGARTGRRSSNSPNMQNWPKRMRTMVVSRFPKGSIVKGDESQLEPRILAHVAGIDLWQEIFDKGKSLYIEAAKAFWKKDVEKDTPLYKVTKSTILATNYGMEPPLFAEKMSVEQDIHLSLEEASQLLKLYHAWVPELPRFFLLQKERLLRYGYVTTLTGQKRRLPCPNGEKTKGFKHMWNQAVNFPIQGLAAHITAAALIDVEAAILQTVGVTLSEHYDNLVRFWGTEKILLDKSPESDIMNIGMEINYPLLINEVHDELVVDTPPDHVSWVPELLKEQMCKVPTLRSFWPTTEKIHLEAEIKTVPSWGG